MAVKKKLSKKSKVSRRKQKLKVVDVDTGIQDGDLESSEESPIEVEASAESATETQSHPKIELRFTGSEYLRAQFPKSFEIAETVASDWVQDGNFEGLPIENPLAQFLASKGLQKAKEVEKKVLESPVTEKIAMKAFETGLKVQSQIQVIKKKLENK